MILGGGFNSKLSQIVREENSLAYYINSSVNKADNLLIINSGISKENYEKVIKLVKKVLKEMSLNIDEDELNKVKIEYLSILEESYDNIDSIIENEIAKNLLNLDEYEVKKVEIEKVSVNDIKNISKKVHLDTVFLLKGDNNGA